MAERPLWDSSKQFSKHRILAFLFQKCDMCKKTLEIANKKK